jgi:hypothetical protein
MKISTVVIIIQELIHLKRGSFPLKKMPRARSLEIKVEEIL